MPSQFSPEAGYAPSPIKVEVIGNPLAATNSRSKVLAAGDVVSATVHYQQGERDYRGVALFKLQRRSLQIDGVSFYWSA